MNTVQRTEQLKRQVSALRDLSRRGYWHLGDRERAFRELCEVASRTLGIERASIWIYDKAHSEIICENLYEYSYNRHSSGQKLARTDFPNYFAALEEERAIAADDAAANPMTREFADSYLAPLGITSMLDAPIMTGGRCVGVICHEHVGPMRTWTQEEETFAASLGDFAALTVEVEQRLVVEQRLSESDKELRLALKAASMGTWMWDIAKDKIVWGAEVGPLFGKPAGWSPSGLDGYLALVYPEDRDQVAATLQRVLKQPALPHYLQHRIGFADGSVRWVEARGQAERLTSAKRPRVFIGTLSDCTAQRELEIQLIQAQKMDGIGQLAGGIAHDFNNLLTVVSGFSEVLLADRDMTEDQKNTVGFILDASDRAAALTRQLLAFARRQPLEVSSVDISQLVETVSDLLRRMIGERVPIEVRIAGPAVASVDAGQIEQVIINLGINARDAMEGAGKLLITTESVEYDGLSNESSLAAGQYVCIDVVDAGCGIPAEILPKIFEPFFTTKAVGQGTGLGLSTCYGIVSQSGGEIRVESTVGEGTTFRVMLPETVGVAPDVVDLRILKEKPGNGENVLVIEDEELVRRLTASLLIRAGYKVLTAADGVEAVAVARATELPIDFVVADVVLPGKGGVAVVEDVRQIHPQLRVLFVSGYTPDLPVAELLENGDFLLKPFRPMELTNLVREILDRDSN